MFIIGQMNTGGAERVINNLCNTLNGEYNITLVVRKIEGADYIPNVNIVEIKELNEGKNLFVGLIKLHKLKKDLQIDTSVSFLLKYNIYNYLSKYKERVIISVRNYITANESIHSKKNLFLYKKIIKKVDLVVNVSEAVMDDQIQHFKSNPNKNIVIPNFCDIDYINKVKYEELPKEHIHLFEGDVIISSGRYTFQKGQWHIIRAFQKVVASNQNIKLVLTGRGALKEYYEELIRELHLEKNVYLLDFVDNVYRYMYHAKAYLLNSFYEGMPNVILEAMACDLPVIATDVQGGTKEILAPSRKRDTYVDTITPSEYGILIPVCDSVMYKALSPLTKEENDLADVMIQLFEDKSMYQRYKQLSHQRVQAFSKDKIIKMWKDIL